MLLYLVLIPLLPFILLFLYLLYKQRSARSLVYNTKDGTHPPCISIFETFNHKLFGKGETFVQHEAKVSKDKGDILIGFQFFQPCVYIRSAELAAYVLRNPKLFEKTMPPFSREVNEFIGSTQVVIANGHDWQRQRKILEPAFMDLKIYQKIFEEKSKIVIKRMKEGVVENVNGLFQKMALDVLGLSIFGYDFDSLSGKIEKNLKAYNTFMELMNSPSKMIYYFVKEKLMPWTSNPELVDALNTLHSLFDKLIAESKKKTNSKDVSLLDMMIASQNLEDAGLTDQEIKDNCRVFFLAGHETTATALAFALLNLAEYPDIQEEIRKEVQSIYKNGELNYDDVKNLEFLGYFIKENMRIFPPGAVVPMKLVTEDTKIGDYFVPKGYKVSIQVYELHNSKEVYGDPEVFRPNRWKKEESKKFPFGSYLPFSLGPRICLGNDFSIMEQKFLVANLLLNYKVSKVNPKDFPQVDPASVLFQIPKNYPLKFEQIQ